MAGKEGTWKELRNDPQSRMGPPEPHGLSVGRGRWETLAGIFEEKSDKSRLAFAEMGLAGDIYFGVASTDYF